MAIEIVIRGTANTSALKDAASDVREVGEAAGQSEGKMKGFFSLIGGGAVGGVLALGAGVAAAASAGLGFNNSMEQARAKINAFTKDGAATTEILEMVADRAAKTPFAFEEMAEAAAGLGPAAKSAGLPLEDLIGQAEVLAASNPSEGLVGATFALKEALSGDFTSAIERFNLSRSYINKLKQEGKPALEIISLAMKQAGYDSGLVAEMANTLQGRWSTFSDTFTTLAGKVTQPIFDALSSGLGGVNDWLTQMTPQLTVFADMLAGRVAQAVQVAGQWLGATVRWVQQLVSVFSSAGGGMSGFQAVLGTIGTQLQALGMQLLGWVQAQLPGWIASLQQMGQAAWQWIVDATPPVLAQLQAWGGQILGWVQAQLPGWTATLQSWGQMAWQWIVDATPPAIAQLQAWGMQLLGWVQAQLPGWTAQLQAWGMIAWQWIQEATPPALAQLAAWGQQLLGYLAANLPTWIAQLLQWGTIAYQWLGEAIPPLLVKAGEFIGAIVSWAYGTALPTLIEWSLKAALALIEWVASDLIPKVGPAFADFLGAVTGALGNILKAVGQMALDIGQGIIDGITEGISKGASAIAEAAKNAAKSALNAAKSALGIKSPSTVFAQMVGLPIAQGMALGISQGAPAVAGAAAGLAGAAVGGAQRVVNMGGVTINQLPGERGDQLADRTAQRLLRAADMRRT